MLKDEEEKKRRQREQENDVKFSRNDLEASTSINDEEEIRILREREQVFLNSPKFNYLGTSKARSTRGYDKSNGINGEFRVSFLIFFSWIFFLLKAFFKFD